jgi:hypothetical protein
MRLERLEFEREYEEAIDEQERAGRTLDDVALEFLYRGDVIRVAVGERAWTGRVVHVGAEVMVLATEAGVEVDLDFDALSSIRVVERSGSEGRALGSKHPETLVARLRELAQTGVEVELGGVELKPPLVGAIQIVASTHLEFRSGDGGDWFVPLVQVGYVVRQPAPG